MNNFELEKYIFSIKSLRKNYRGIFASDELDKIQNFGPQSFVIINYCPGEGCHWVCCYNHGSSIEYFDPSGLPSHLINKNIDSFLKKQKKRVTFNRTTLQNETSTTCGHHVLIYLYFKSLNYSLNNLLTLYYKFDLKRNDFIVMKLFKKIFKKN